VEDPEVHAQRKPFSPCQLQGPIMTNIVRRCRGEVEGEELGGVNEDWDRDVGKEESEAVRVMVNTFRAGRVALEKMRREEDDRGDDGNTPSHACGR
jgi:hypothetical protein